MKKIYLLILLNSVLGIAQIPANYYSSATGTGYALKTQLKKIINSANDGLSPEYFHVDRGYGAGVSQTNNGLWSGYGTTDRDNGIGYENDNTIVDIYSENPSGADPYNYLFNSSQCGNVGAEGTCYNREHLIPQSYFGGSNPPSQFAIMRNDIQHVYPTDGKVNGTRSDFAFGKVNVATSTSLNGSKLGSALNSGYSAGFSGTVFEPIDAFKGDIARVFLYFATRYEDEMDDLYSTYTTVDTRVMFDGSTNRVFNSTFLNILLTWHEQDPVSTKEIVRNNASFVHQSNRNPFIDHPEYVAMIWGVSLANDNFYDSAFNIYPNPSNGTFNIEYDNTIGDINVEIYSTIGQKVFEKQNVNNNTITTSGLQSGVYLVKIVKDSKSIVKKIVID
jgi:endonuclease I